MRKAVFAGSFDPFTVGHLDLVKRASRMFDEVVVAVASDTGKSCRASLAERVEMAQKSVNALEKVVVLPFSGLLTDFAASQNAAFLVRGIRNSVDLAYESNLSAVYKSLDGTLEIVYLIAPPDCAFVSSSFVRDLLSCKGDVSAYISSEIKEQVKEIYD